MKKNLYVAYGSNLNISQMNCRCPGAKLYATGVIRDYELQFKGRENSAYATIGPKAGGAVPVVVWEISRQNERSLDVYEGWPHHYYKETVQVHVADKTVDAMVYIMNPKMGYGQPSPYYYQCVREGYQDCGLDVSVLEKALQESVLAYYEGQNDMEEEMAITEEEEQEEMEMGL